VSTVASSRRHVLEPHASDPTKLARCPVCLATIDEDHEEAQRIHAALRNVADIEAPAVVGFALV
jgi:hypothetical protein